MRQPLAGSGKRLLNFWIDRGANYGIGAGLGFLGGIFIEPTLLDSLLGNNLLVYGLGYIIGLIYYTLFEGACGRTLGKLITGTKVLSKDHQPAGFLNILGRSFIRMIPFEAFSIFFGKGSMWHDDWSGTVTVDLRAKAIPAPRKFIPNSAGRPVIIRHTAPPSIAGGGPRPAPPMGRPPSRPQ